MLEFRKILIHETFQRFAQFSRGGQVFRGQGATALAPVKPPKTFDKTSVLRPVRHREFSFRQAPNVL